MLTLYQLWEAHKIRKENGIFLVLSDLTFITNLCFLFFTFPNIFKYTSETNLMYNKPFYTCIIFLKD
ncbi:hypothetical protein BpHYR1_029205 [Brachionus plicatilis]|uniref:Uncharacterized protein n=1 Tax=Brachionus plicatilis TaxID=10195 RepID=A0A3M7PMT2_BRAPC|nr:hypothetical protein BpHYR1_029205 [Brachionus plicatilis]